MSHSSLGNAASVAGPLQEDVAVGASPLSRLVSSRIQSMTALVVLAAAAVVPAFSPFALAAGAAVAWGRWRHFSSYPLKMPVGGGRDPNDNDPGMRRKEAKGILFLGHDDDRREIWLTAEDARRHMFVTGGSGSGKSEALLGVAANALSWGGGMVFVDGQGDVGIYAKLLALSRRFGREKDLLVVNFMVGNSSQEMADLSMRMNPFRQGSPDSLTYLMVSLMEDVGGDGAMWKGRASMMLLGVMQALCWLRDNRDLPLDVATIRDNLGFRKLLELGDDPRIPEAIRRNISGYLKTLPGFRADKGFNQSQTTFDQHGYLEMQFVRITGRMADCYGHILRDPGVDVDIYDVVLNRRILLIMLPGLEKSSEEIANLGKVIVTMLKGMMGATLSAELESGSKVRPTAGAKSPFVCILDDVDSYAVDGMALMSAQARALGFSMCYSSTDIETLNRRAVKEGPSIVANTNTKIRLGKPPGEDDERVALRDLRRDTAGSATILSAGRRVEGSIYHVGPVAQAASRPLGMPALISPVWQDQDKPEDACLETVETP